MTQKNLGNACLTQGQRLGGEPGTTALARAVEAYEAALRMLHADTKARSV